MWHLFAACAGEPLTHERGGYLPLRPLGDTVQDMRGVGALMPLDPRTDVAGPQSHGSDGTFVPLRRPDPRTRA